MVLDRFCTGANFIVTSEHSRRTVLITWLPKDHYRITENLYKTSNIDIQMNALQVPARMNRFTSVSNHRRPILYKVFKWEFSSYWSGLATKWGTAESSSVIIAFHRLPKEFAAVAVKEVFSNSLARATPKSCMTDYILLISVFNFLWHKLDVILPQDRVRAGLN